MSIVYSESQHWHLYLNPCSEGSRSVNRLLPFTERKHSNLNEKFTEFNKIKVSILNLAVTLNPEAKLSR